MVQSNSQVIALSAIVAHYANSIELSEGTTLVSHDAVIDPVADKVLLTIVIDAPEEVTGT